jgi:asparagine synthase (glutamine-hydrolysing)
MLEERQKRYKTASLVFLWIRLTRKMSRQVSYDCYAMMILLAAWAKRAEPESPATSRWQGSNPTSPSASTNCSHGTWLDDCTPRRLRVRPVCGIAGRVDLAPFETSGLSNALEAMHHRGPDSRGSRTSRLADAIAMLGAVRLRIIDTRAEADQPLTNEDGTIVLVFNGELYSHAELRSDLLASGHTFATNTDTECLVHLYEHVDGDVNMMLGRLRGMFAFALWDEKRQRLVVACDRLGIKPVVWTETGSGVAFASEIRALVAAKWITPELDPQAIAAYLQWGIVPGGDTMFRGVRRLRPGEVLTWDPTNGTRVSRWWSPSFVTDERLGNEDEAVRELRTTLVDSVARHLIADRPVGLFLSSGTDSAALAAIAAGHGLPRALTVTFPENLEFDEGPGARAIANRFGVPHDEVPVVGTDVVKALPDILRAMDRPSADAVNAWLVCRAAHEAGLVVALSGLGGDELLAGYRSFTLAPRVRRARHALSLLPNTTLRRLGIAAGKRTPGSRFARVAEAERGIVGAYDAVRQLFGSDDLAAYGITPPPHNAPEDLPKNETDAIMRLELHNYLADQLLPDTDAMSMAHSLEVRVPILDDTVVSTALAIPGHVRRAAGKRLLAEAATLGAPSTKRTFTPPFAQWVQGPLRDVVREGLQSEELPFADLVPTSLRRSLWDQLDAGRGHWSRAWAVTVLRLWPAANGFDWA